MSNFVTCRQLANEFGLDASNTRKYVLAKGFSFIKVRTLESGNQIANALSETDAETLRMLRRQEGFGNKTATAIVGNGWGVFYVIQLVPDLDAQRIKLGFASGMDGRLAAHRTAAPTAQVVKWWPCRGVWERAAMDCATQIDCVPISNEVYQCTDLAPLIARCDAFFALMPTSLQ